MRVAVLEGKRDGSLGRVLLLPAGPGAREQLPPCLTCCSRNSLSLHGRGKGLDKFMGEKSIRKVLKKTIPASQIAGHKQESLCTHFARARSLPSASPPAAGATGEPVDGHMHPHRQLLGQPNLCPSKPAHKYCPHVVFHTKSTQGGLQTDSRLASRDAHTCLVLWPAAG